MVKRSIYIVNACQLSVSNRQLVVENIDSGERKTESIEDLGFVLIENQRARITIPALIALGENNTAVVFCDEKHMPSMIALPLESNWIQSEVYKCQVEASVSLKKKLWKQVVGYKIRNQARLLDSIGLNGKILRPFYEFVKSGDSDNREGVAAKAYWKALFGEGFVRDQDGVGVNALLNYGYSVLRAGMARAIVGSGLNPAFGIFHRNQYNAFPLADDLMEPYRPFVDQIVVSLCRDGILDLTRESKQKLLNVMFQDTRFVGFVRPLQIAMSITSSSLVKCFKGKPEVLCYPYLE